MIKRNGVEHRNLPEQVQKNMEDIAELQSYHIMDYEDLANRPKINSTTLSGNKSGADLGLQDKLTAGTNITIANNVISATAGEPQNYIKNAVVNQAGTKLTLTKKDDSTVEFEPAGGSGAVQSVNGKTGVVVLTNTDVGAPSTQDLQQGLATRQTLLTDTQMAAVNSGINATKVAEIDDKSEVEGTSEGDNWTSITIDGVTKSIPTSSASAGVASIGGKTGAITLGEGLSMNDHELNVDVEVEAPVTDVKLNGVSVLVNKVATLQIAPNSSISPMPSGGNLNTLDISGTRYTISSGGEPGVYVKSVSETGGSMGNGEVVVVNKDGTTNTFDSARALFKEDLVDRYSLVETEKQRARTNIGAAAVSGTNDGTNWQTITINNVTKAIPAGGSGAVNDVKIDGASVVTSGTANIPKASSLNLGVVKGGVKTNETEMAAIDNNGYIWYTPGSGSEPNAYLKSAAVNGNTLTLTNKDDTTVTFTPQGGSSYTAGDDITINSNVIKTIYGGKNIGNADYDKTGLDITGSVIQEDQMQYVTTSNFTAEELEVLWTYVINGYRSAMPQLICLFGNNSLRISGDIETEVVNFDNKQFKFKCGNGNGYMEWTARATSPYTSTLFVDSGYVYADAMHLKRINAYLPQQTKPMDWSYMPLSVATKYQINDVANQLNERIDEKSTVSGENDGTNWTSITIDDETYNIPQGGGGGSYSAGHGINISNNTISTADSSIDAGSVDGYSIAVVSSVPSSPVANTIYFVPYA